MKKALWLLLIALYAPHAGAIYKCKNERGETLFGDTPPAGCGSNVPIYEISPSGTVLRRIDPPLTPEQIKERQEEATRLKKARAEAAEQKRRDMALLNSYTSATEFDVARDRNIEPVQGRIRSTNDRLKELDVNEKQLNATAERYRGKDGSGEVPGWVGSNLEQITKERKSLKASIAADEKEIEGLRAKYESDKQRWIVLRGGAANLPDAGEAASAPAVAPGRKPGRGN
ncbi:MAG TPA: DUF4124 domain-containing protein [Usitatibacter sp.]|nr:DUF4124 domain-containing protein [Usitatibacter sp.]